MWGAAAKTALKPLITLQKRAIRNITKSQYNVNTAPLFKKLNILKLQELYSVQLNLLMYKHKNNALPPKIQKMFTRNTDVYKHNTRQIQATHINHRRLKCVSDSFICAGPRSWLNLPTQIKECRTEQSFKTNLKKLFIAQY